MKKIVTLRSVSLACVSLLFVSLAPTAYAGHDHDRSHDAIVISHAVHRDNDFRRERFDHHQRPGNSHDKRHHGYREQARHHHSRQVTRQWSINAPRLVLRLPWLLFVDY
jgi:hypothetical protein